MCRRIPVFVRQAANPGVDAVRVSERVRSALQLHGGCAVRGRLFSNVLRGILLFRADRASQPKRGPFVERGVLHVLRAMVQDRRAGGRRADAPVLERHPGRAAGRPPGPVPGGLVRRASVSGRVRIAIAILHANGAAGRSDRILVQRHGPDGRLRAGVGAILRAGPRVQPRQRHGRGAGSGSRPIVRGPIADLADRSL